MNFKYLDIANILISIIGLNLSILGILFSMKYKVEVTTIRLFGMKINIKRTKVPIFIFFINFSILLVYVFAEINYASIAYISPILNQTLTVFIYVTIVSIVSSLIVYEWIIQYNAEVYSGSESVNKYLEFTDDIKTDSDILIVGGDLSFFGYLPSDNYNFCQLKCNRQLQEFNSTLIFPNKAENVCPHLPKCMLHNVQLEQIMNKYQTSRLRLRVMCNKPNDGPANKKYRLVIAELIELFNDNVDIRFYPTGSQSLPVKGRIKTTNNGIRQFLWQWKSDSDVYIFPEVWSDQTAIGKTIIHLHDVVLWEQCTSIDSLTAENYRNELQEFILHSDLPN